MKSPITQHEGVPAFKVGDYQYYKDNTGSLYGEAVDQSNMVGGTGDRTAGFETRLPLVNHKDRVLDFGCGKAQFVEFLQSKGIEAEGYDPYDSYYKDMPDGEFDKVWLIEVIEHTTAPFEELDLIKTKLKPDGLVFIETSFSNWVTLGDPYANPTIGHNTIFSHQGLDYLMLSKGFTVKTPVNRNIRVYGLL